MNPTTPPLSSTQERLIHKRVNAKMGWFVHALVFVLVNAGLTLAAALSGRAWAVVPAFGWSLGLMIHGIVVFGGWGLGASLRQHLLARERAQQANARQPF